MPIDLSSGLPDERDFIVSACPDVPMWSENLLFAVWDPAADVAMVETDRPLTSACAGNDGAAMAIAINPNITSPSKMRSTPMDASAVEKRTGSWREATYARATSPARAGSRLFAMNPIVVACQSGLQGRG